MRSLRSLRLRSAVPAAALILLIACGAAAQADGMDVVRSFNPPGANPYGLDYVETSTGIGTLYHTDWYTGDVYSITTGGTATLLFNVPDSIGQPYWNYTAAAICFVGDPDNQAAGTLYIVEPDRGGAPYYTIIRSFTLSGAHLNTWDVSDIIGRATGITFDGTHFWLIGYADLVQCDTDFNLVQDHIVPWAVGDGGLDFDAPTNMLYNLSRGFQSLVVFERGAEFITHQQYIGGYGLTSLAIGHITRESRNLWLLDNSNIPSVIMEINDDYYDPVETATWGSIKALYR